MIVTLQSDERRRDLKLFFLFNPDKRTLCSKICRAHTSEILRLLQTGASIRRNEAMERTTA